MKWTGGRADPFVYLIAYENEVAMNLLDQSAPHNKRTGRVPEVMLIGAAKSATTNLFMQMCAHPNIFGGHLEDGFGEQKEPSFFSFDENYARGLSYYKSLYADARPDELCVDASTNYTRWPQLPWTAERMAYHAPNARLIYVIRHPVDRAYSHYVHRHMRELHPGEPIVATFEEHVQRDPMCIDSSLYMRQIEQYLEHYPRSALHVVLTTDFEREPLKTLQGICRFLDIDPNGARIRPLDSWHANISEQNTNSRIRKVITRRFTQIPVIGPLARRMPKSWRDQAYRMLAKAPWSRRAVSSFTPKPMTAEVRAMFLDFFERPNQDLADFLGRDLSEWSR
ncbi:MAG: sulfotransferase family protein [Planctomycetota bacterium]